MEYALSGVYLIAGFFIVCLMEAVEREDFNLWLRLLITVAWLPAGVIYYFLMMRTRKKNKDKCCEKCSHADSWEKDTLTEGVFWCKCGKTTVGIGNDTDTASLCAYYKGTI
jgi:hypothetical protein